MPFISCSIEGADHSANLHRLVNSRWIVLVAMVTLVIVSPTTLNIELPQAPLLGIIGICIAFNTLVHWRLKNATCITAGELLSQLLFDIAALGALLFFSGGATNPLVSLLLPTVAIAAIALPARCVILVGGCAVTIYSLLMVYYVPLPLPDANRATRLHLIGMWLTFAVSALMIGWFVVRMTRLIRERDAELATAREQALRDERIMAMGTLAAGAAHELGTPLATMALITGELSHDTMLSDETQQDIVLLKQLIGQCKKIITDLARRAEAERLENIHYQAVDKWLENVRQHWHANRPQANSQLVTLNAGTAPNIFADPRLEQAILNLLNNAVNASSLPLRIELDWNATNLQIDIRDQGPGFPPSVLKHGGRTSFPDHKQGSGVGLMLTRSAIEQLGGSLSLINPDEGGALARIELPYIHL